MAICKTRELNEKQLNFLVAQLEDFDNGDWLPDYSTDWAAGGTIIEQELIHVHPVYHSERTEGGTDIYRQDGWSAHIEPKAFWVTPQRFTAPTPLIAAMRAYIASKLGEEVEIPEELM